MAITSTYLETTGDQPVYESAGQQVVTSMYFCNTDTGNAVTVNMYIVNDSGVSAGAVNQLYKNLQIGPGNTYVMATERLMLEDMNQIRVASNIANTVTVTVSTYSV